MVKWNRLMTLVVECICGSVLFQNHIIHIPRTPCFHHPIRDSSLYIGSKHIRISVANVVITTVEYMTAGVVGRYRVGHHVAWNHLQRDYLGIGS